MLEKSPMYSYLPAKDMKRAREFYERTSLASQAFWQVENIETAELYDLPEGKMTTPIAVGGGAKAAWFKDSEGNILAVIADE